MENVTIKIEGSVTVRPGHGVRVISPLQDVMNELAAASRMGKAAEVLLARFHGTVEGEFPQMQILKARVQEWRKSQRAVDSRVEDQMAAAEVAPPPADDRAAVEAALKAARTLAGMILGGQAQREDVDDAAQALHYRLTVLDQDVRECPAPGKDAAA